MLFNGLLRQILLDFLPDAANGLTGHVETSSKACRHFSFLVLMGFLAGVMELIWNAVAVAAAAHGEDVQGNGQMQIPIGAFQAAVPAAPASAADIVSMLQQVVRMQHELRAVSDNIPRRLRNSRVADGAALLRPLCRERVSL